MKKLLALFALIILTSSVSFCQYTDKPKGTVETKKVTPPCDSIKNATTVNVPSNTPSNGPSDNQIYVYVPKLKDKKSDLSFQEDGEDVKTDGFKLKDFYPMKQYEAYISFTKLKNLNTKFDGGSFYVVVRENPNLKDKTTYSRKTYGAFVEGGRYKGQISSRNDPSFDLTIEQIGGGLSYAMTRNRPGWNALTLNFGVLQEVENGSVGLFQERQVDLFFTHTGWVDLTRTRNTFLSKTNFSWYWKKPLSTNRTALYDKHSVPSPSYDKETIGCQFDQTLLMFLWNDDIGIHFGGSIGYQHMSAGQQDWYLPAGFIEIYGYNGGKIGQFLFGKNIRGNGGMDKESVTVLRFSLDVMQLVRTVFKFNI